MAYSMDLTQGSVLKKLIRFATPILFTNLVQRLYHMADLIVVGNYAQNSTVSLAAVGSAGSITALVLNLFIGLSLGANIVCANYYGAKEEGKLRQSMHTSLLIAFLGGIFVAAVGMIFSRSMLLLIDTPESVLDAATSYLKIIFLGQPASLIFNFGASILRAHGDSKRSMYISMFTGFVNVILNLIFVIGFRWEVSGVAWATTISSCLSGVIVLYILFTPHGEFRMKVSELKIHLPQLKRVSAVGIPSGLNEMVFSVSNTIIAAAVNSFGDVYIAGNSAAGNVDSILHVFLASFSSACVAFAGQNFGAKKLKRIDRMLVMSFFMVSALLLTYNVLISIFPYFFMHLFTPEVAVVEAGIPRMLILGWGYMLYSGSVICFACSRGMGKSVVPTFLNMFCICVPRILWVNFLFPMYPAYWFLCMCYPVSWILSSAAQMIYYLVARQKVKRQFLREEEEKQFLTV